MGINQLGWRGSEVVTVNLRVPDDKKTNPEVVHMWNSDLLMNLPDRQAKVRKTYDPFILTGIKLYTMVLYLWYTRTLYSCRISKWDTSTVT